MPCRFSLMAAAKSLFRADVRATQRTGKHRPESGDARAVEEYKS
jgi:hypothetical protein